ncbi:hypothetical protein [Leptospira alexanderi]|uniref:Uncharacterized protein n=1 Tax=Leptospira alexanderi serovar Manhao 3 str. L 60 TaxID=1049759 RepID=V6HY36_9LEPT|nr:hypothetical protein [Leptospira alexanderi]EQA61962.1 hypothetical protein LEP1GSC062_2047 [Leptospira alexanderi serovar Manhao 3 str. L 60]
MIYHYESYFSNHVHQLVVSISKHLFLLKNEEIKYQKKSFDINLKNYSKSTKSHLVHCFIKDHFSGASYGEIYSTDQLFSIEKFLFNAWKIKKIYKFHGLPEFLMVPKSVIEHFPEITNIFNHTNIKLIETKSGFQSGAPIIIKEWEKQVCYAPMLYKLLSFSKLQENIEYFNNEINSFKLDNSDSSKIKKWSSNLNQTNIITNETDFFKIFN